MNVPSPRDDDDDDDDDDEPELESVPTIVSAFVVRTRRPPVFPPRQTGMRSGLRGYRHEHPLSDRSDGVHALISPRSRSRDLHMSAVPWTAVAI